MKDFSLPYLLCKKLLDEYYNAMVKQDKAKAYQIASDLVEIAQKLENIAHDEKTKRTLC
jgi:hypothetical protein